MMSQLGTVAERILDAVHDAPGCELDDLVLRLPELTWNQVFLEVDRLSRTGQVRVTAMGEGTYAIRLPKNEKQTQTPHISRETQKEAPMPFSIRPFRRSPEQCSVTYHVGPFQGQGTVWNLSLNGWKLSGDLPLRVGETCSLTVNLPNQSSIFVAAAIVRWARGQEYGVETLVVEKQTQSRLEHLVKQLGQESVESIP
jgi:hypothetical protein